MPFGYAAFNALASCQRRDNALAALVGHAYDDLVGVAIYASPTVKCVLARERWQNGPLAIDVEVKGRGGWKG